MRFLPASALEPGMLLARDIVSNSRTFMLKKGVTLTAEYIKYLQEKGYLGAYIADEISIDICPEEPISAKTLLDGITAVEKGDIEGLLQSAKEIVSDVSGLTQLSIDMLDLRSFDEYTYHHSVNVAVYAVAVGKYMGLTDLELIQLCQAGICHDLGKQRIPLEIINKPGRLTDEEFAEIKKHPKYSYDILYSNQEISAIVRQAVICHHENENGSGYPFGRDGSQLPIMAKILHGVDVYDALTSKRPYKDPYSPSEAFDYLIGGKSILFNDAVVDAMRKVIPTYPIGMEVCLSNGETAVVYEHTSDPLRPAVKLLETGENIVLTLPKYENLFIAASGYMSLDYTSAVENLNEDRLKAKQRKLEIMLVDDSPLSLHQTGAALNNEEYHIIPLQSGIAAINYIKAKGAPDLIIMDIEMPMLNGIAAVTKIQEMGHKNVPIIFLTAKGDKETVLKCKSVNAKDYIIKPVRPTYLKERVALALDERLDR